MSFSHSIGTDSTSSSNTMPTNQSNEQEMDPSNILYNDHHNYQIIFTNDSRFFDTSLHLYKSYRKLGYVQSDKKKSKKNQFPTSTYTLKPQPNGHHDYGRSKPMGSRNDHEVNGHNDGTLKPPTSKSNGNDPNSSIIRTKYENSNGGASHQRPWPSPNHPDSSGDSSDEPDIIITRL